MDWCVETTAEFPHGYRLVCSCGIKSSAELRYNVVKNMKMTMCVHLDKFISQNS